jgi:hypothetical protein
VSGALRLIELRPPVSGRDQLVQPADDDGLIDIRCTVDEIEHEIEDDLGVRPYQQGPQGLERNAPSLRIDEKESEGLVRDVSQDRRQHFQEIGSVRLDGDIRIMRRDAREPGVCTRIAFDKKGRHVHVAPDLLPRLLCAAERAKGNSKRGILEFLVGALPRTCKSVHIHNVRVRARGLVDERFEIAFQKYVLHIGLFATDVVFERQHVTRPRPRRAEARQETHSTPGDRACAPPISDAGPPTA